MTTEAVTPAETEPNGEKEKVVLLVDQSKSSKRRVFITRASWSLVMIFSFLFVLVYLQQPGLLVFILMVQSMMYKELIAINSKKEIDVDNRFIGFVQWCWFALTIIMTYGLVLKPHFMLQSPLAAAPWVNRLRIALFEEDKLLFFCFIGYLATLMAFGTYLKKQHLRYHFQRFSQSHVVLVLVVAQSTAMVSTMYEGLFWFLLPAGLVICNDIWAFIFGFFLGRTPLISISPKKTWEGFIGGFAATIFFGAIGSRLLRAFPLMTCPKVGFRLEFWPNCEVDPIFKPLEGDGFWASMGFAPVDRHMVVLALFASLIAPFGGFFASGFKRAFKIKDFGTSIPGHGGAVDRMDCQVLMGMFVLLYLNAFVIPYRDEAQAQHNTMKHVTRMLLAMSEEDQKGLYQQLGERLVIDGLL